MKEYRKGQCLCGRTTFEYKGPELWCAHCHCESCRKNTSAPFTTFVGVAHKDFRYTGRTPERHSSSEGVCRSFCGNCGTPVAYESERFPGEIHLYLASLERSGELMPQCHVWWSEKVDWIHLSDDLPRYPHGGGS